MLAVWKSAIFSIFLAGYFLPHQAMAEQFLGEVDEDEGPLPSATGQKPDESARPRGDKIEPGAHWSFGLSLGGGPTGFGGSVEADYHLNRFLAPGIHISYESVKSDVQFQKISSIETPVTLYGANKTPFWPFASGGPSVIAWEIGDNLGTIDKSASAAWFYVYGVLLRFSNRLGFVIQSKTTSYLSDTPAEKVTDRGLPTEQITFADKKVSAVSFRFQLSL
jgi:hypothetical protein